MNMFGVLCMFISHFLYSLDMYVCGILLNWIHLFNWDVTFMVSKQSFLRIYGLVCLLSYCCGLGVAS